MSKKFKLNDEVLIISGKDKGKIGFIKKIYKKIDRVIINGLKMVYKHKKSIPSNNVIGGIIKKESKIHISNISHFCSKRNKRSKIGFRYIKNKKFRYLKLNNILI